MEPPQLPCEVIERIIGHSGDHPDTLSSFSFTCSQLRPRALCLMVGRVTLWSRNRTFAFVDFVQAKPHLKPLVRSIVVDPTEFAPFPLLHILPNLSEIEFTSWILSHNILALHPSSLTCFQRFGTHIQTLHLSDLSFATYLPLARLLLAFTNISHLTCTDVVIKTAGDGAPLAVVRRRLSEKMRLKTLTMSSPKHLVGAIVPQWLRSSSSQTHSSSLLKRDTSVGAFLFHPDLAPSTVENLRLMGAEPDAYFNLSSWSRLRSLVLRLPYDHRLLTSAAKLLEESYSPTLTEVTRELYAVESVLHVSRDISSSGQLESRPAMPKALERALLGFSQPRITWTVSEPLRVGRHSFWIGELGKQFPVLFHRGALELKSRTVFPAGHDSLIHAFVTSPDGAWVASGSDDGTVILWDVQDGKIAQQWVPHGYKPVRSLAFSPDSRQLVSGGDDRTLIVWDLSQASARQVAALEGHTNSISSCMWSPDGRLVASASLDASVRLWDAHTFRQLRILDEWPMTEVPYLRFSPDGRRLASASIWGTYYIWNVASAGTLLKHVQTKPPHPRPRELGSVVACTFDLGNTRFAAASGPDAVEMWDVDSETGERLFVLEHPSGMNDVSFSPDGKLLLAALENGTVTIWDAHTGTELSLLTGHKMGVVKACFSPCGKYVVFVSASRDETVQLWRTRDGSCVATCSEHESFVTHVTFSPDGKILSSCAGDGTVVIRRMQDIVPIDSTQGS